MRIPGGGGGDILGVGHVENESNAMRLGLSRVEVDGVCDGDLETRGI